MIVTWQIVLNLFIMELLESRTFTLVYLERALLYAVCPQFLL